MTVLLGHDDNITAFLHAYNGQKLHHAWLLKGPKGVGKALFAQQASHHILSHEPGPQTSAPIFAPAQGAHAAPLRHGSHPDHVYLTREPKSDADQKKKEAGKVYDRRRNITIDQVRALQRRLTTRPAMANRRTVIIDSIDDMEAKASNCLLKSLEEPVGDTIFFLVSHNAGQLLPTIKSRCFQLRFEPLDNANMQRVLPSIAPELPQTEYAQLVAASAGSPGNAISLNQFDIIKLSEIVAHIMQKGDPSKDASLTLIQTLSGKGGAERLQMFLKILPSLIAQEIRQRGALKNEHDLQVWRETINLARQAATYNYNSETLLYHIGDLLSRLAPTKQQ